MAQFKTEWTGALLQATQLAESSRRASKDARTQLQIAHREWVAARKKVEQEKVDKELSNAKAVAEKMAGQMMNCGSSSGGGAAAVFRAPP
eukprot:15421614-Alexandrium_andersonii.AAC.1